MKKILHALLLIDTEKRPLYPKDASLDIQLSGLLPGTLTFPQQLQSMIQDALFAFLQHGLVKLLLKIGDEGCFIHHSADGLHIDPRHDTLQ